MPGCAVRNGFPALCWATSGLGPNQPLTCGLRGHGELPTWLSPLRHRPVPGWGKPGLLGWSESGVPGPRLVRTGESWGTLFQRGGPGILARLAQPPVRAPLQHPHCPTVGTGNLPLGRWPWVAPSLTHSLAQLGHWLVLEFLPLQEEPRSGASYMQALGL